MALVSIIFFGIILFTILLGYALFFKNSSKLMIIAILFILTFLILLAFTTYDSIIELRKFDDFQKIGPYGDYIGGILNPLIAVFGVFAAGFAFYAQYQANKQVQEQFEKQEKKDYLQNFENKFFNLINIHHQIVSDIDISTKKIYHFEEELSDFIKNNKIINPSFTKNLIEENNYSSRDVFQYYFDLLDYLLWIDLQIIGGKVEEKHSESMKIFEDLFEDKQKLSYKNYILISKFPSIYSLVYNTVSSDFGHYFRNLYRIIKYVDSMKFSDNLIEDFKIKYSYTSTIRSQLSDAELKVIFFNCLYYYGKDKFKPLLEKYSFFKFINTDESDNDNIFKDYYKFYDSIALEPIKDEQILLEYLKKDIVDELKIEKITENIEIEIQTEVN